MVTTMDQINAASRKINDIIGVQRLLDTQFDRDLDQGYALLEVQGRVYAHTLEHRMPDILLPPAVKTGEGREAPPETGVREEKGVPAGVTERVVTLSNGRRYHEIAWPLLDGHAGVLRMGFSQHDIEMRISQLWKETAGLTFIILLLALIAPTEQHAGTATLAITLMLEEIGIGLLVAFVLTSLTIRLLKISYLNGWQLPLWRQLTMPGLALLCFALAQTLGGSGFIAAFVGGLLIGRRLGEHKHAYMDSCEGYGDLLSVVIWMVFGATLLPTLPELMQWQYWLYAVASLTLLRMVPVWLSLIGTGLKPELKLFIGWFGPRGLASIVFAVMVLQNQPALIGQRPIIATVLCTIILSVLLHGLTANPWVERFKPR